MTVKEKILHRLASSHIAGKSYGDALEVTRRASANGRSVTICVWNEPGESPKLLLKKYSHLLDVLSREEGNYHISLKAPSFHYNLDLLRQITDQAAISNIGVEFDSHEPETAQQTMDVVQNIKLRYNNIFCALPSRWSRSIRDADWAVEHQIGVRIVKGQWRDPAEPNLDCRKNFLTIADRLASRAVFVSVATHESSLAREALQRLKQSGTPCELEVMFSLPMSVTHEAERLDVPVRVYVPYGHPSLPYNISNVSARPAVALWALRNFLIGRPPKQRRNKKM